jgi:hypothetical protein
MLIWRLLGMVEENHDNLIMVYFHTRLESGSDFTALSSLSIVTSFSLQSFNQRLIDVISFRLTISFCSQSFLFKRANKLGSGFTHHLVCGIYDTKFPTRVSFPCSICYLLYHFNFSFDAQNLPFIHDCSHVITLPVSCSLQE